MRECSSLRKGGHADVGGTDGLTHASGFCDLTSESKPGHTQMLCAALVHKASLRLCMQLSTSAAYPGIIHPHAPS
eukprot:357733-Pelagomonas_calceolata.AAC.10